MKKEIIPQNVRTEELIRPIRLPEGKCSTLYCGDCSYFNPQKTSYGKCWCGYYKMYSRVASDHACSHYHS